jgi:hypothetical protein
MISQFVCVRMRVQTYTSCRALRLNVCTLKTEEKYVSSALSTTPDGAYIHMCMYVCIHKQASEINVHLYM